LRNLLILLVGAIGLEPTTPTMSRWMVRCTTTINSWFYIMRCATQSRATQSRRCP